MSSKIIFIIQSYNENILKNKLLLNNIYYI